MQNNKLVYREYVKKDEIIHAPYSEEQEFFTHIKDGNINEVRELCKESLLNKKGLGVLSKNNLRNIRYHFIVTTALVARYCIEAGLETSVAYGLSDYYIEKADTLKSEEEIAKLHPQMCEDYTKRMRAIRTKKICSKPVAECMDYICDNLHNEITLDDLAKLTELNSSYLSRLFKSEAGIGINTYIQKKRMETAANMLVYTDYSIADISTMLSFADQSYFGQIFKKYYEVTPREYRNINFRKSGMN